MPISCAIRCQRLDNYGAITHQARHAQRLDETSRLRRRPDHTGPASIAWSKAQAHPDQPAAVDPALDYQAAFRAHKESYRAPPAPGEDKPGPAARERKGSPLALHLLAIVSPKWVEAGGNPHDPKNPRVQQLIVAARGWAAKEFGADATWAWRYDIDETGSAVVDLFVSPVFRNKTGKAWILCPKALDLIAERYGHRRDYSYRALQTSWAEYLQAHLDPVIQRGRPVEETRREHVSPEIFKAAAQEKKRDLAAMDQAAAQARRDRDEEIIEHMIDEARAATAAKKRDDQNAARWRAAEEKQKRKDDDLAATAAAQQQAQAWLAEVREEAEALDADNAALGLEGEMDRAAGEVVTEVWADWLARVKVTLTLDRLAACQHDPAAARRFLHGAPVAAATDLWRRLTTGLPATAPRPFVWRYLTAALAKVVALALGRRAGPTDIPALPPPPQPDGAPLSPPPPVDKAALPDPTSAQVLAGAGTWLEHQAVDRDRGAPSRPAPRRSHIQDTRATPRPP